MGVIMSFQTGNFSIIFNDFFFTKVNRFLRHDVVTVFRREARTGHIRVLGIITDDFFFQI
jgi:hypothetical protein